MRHRPCWSREVKGEKGKSFASCGLERNFVWEFRQLVN